MIDKVIEWGEKYKIHTCLNIHGAPGTVLTKKQNRDTISGKIKNLLNFLYLTGRHLQNGTRVYHRKF